MKRKIIIAIFLSLFIFFPLFKTNSSTNLSSEERIVLIERLKVLINKINDFRWQLQKIDLQKEVKAMSYIIIDLSNNSVLLRRNNEHSYPIASMTKLMSAVITSENIDIEQRITLTSKMLEPSGYSPSLYLGSTVTAKDLLKASLVQSTNDAAESLTFFLSEGEFVKLMNEKAKEIGMNNTYFGDAHGLNPLNRASAPDIAKLLIYIKNEHPEILEMTINNDFWLPDHTGRLLKFFNLNLFHGIAEFVGGKTGYLPEAKQTFTGIFEFNQKPYAVVLLYSTNRSSDIQKVSNWLKRRP